MSFMSSAALTRFVYDVAIEKVYLLDIGEEGPCEATVDLATYRSPTRRHHHRRSSDTQLTSRHGLDKSHRSDASTALQ